VARHHHEKRTYRPRFRGRRCDPAILLAECQFRESGSRQWWRRGIVQSLASAFVVSMLSGDGDLSFSDASESE